MSDTPRTDVLLIAHDMAPTHISLISHSRELERELNAANERIKRLEEFVEQLTNPKFTRDDLPKEALLQRIKRLEEVGDKLAGLHLFSVWKYDSAKAHVDEWRKAKEAKP